MFTAMAYSPACLCRLAVAFTPRPRVLNAPISTSAPLRAGHNKWSKIRHEKGAADRKRGAQNIILARAITNATRSQSISPRPLTRPDYAQVSPPTGS